MNKRIWDITLIAVILSAASVFWYSEYLVDHNPAPTQMTKAERGNGCHWIDRWHRGEWHIARWNDKGQSVQPFSQGSNDLVWYDINDRSNSFTVYYTNLCWVENQTNFLTNFLTISNSVFIQYSIGSCVVRVSDAQWQLITNACPDKLRTNDLSFWRDSQ